MDLQFWFYIFLFVIFGVPLIGFIVRNVVRFGRYVYKSFPFLQKFFDEYYEHFALGSAISIFAVLVYGVLYWIGVV